MATIEKTLVTPQQVTNSTATYYTATGVKTRIHKITVTNPTATARDITIYVVPSGGSAGDSTTIVKTRTVLPLETWDCWALSGHIIPSGGTLQAVASASTALTLYASGADIT
jgi:hypothetical protein